MELHSRTWGDGDRATVIALHPLALESSAFEEIAGALAERGLRTLAVDLPGFGVTPAPAKRLTPEVLAAPVIELARGLDPPPLLLGISLGGRVALEAVLRAPDAFRSAVLVSPYLPWKRARWLLALAHGIDPQLAERVPLERIWPLLKGLTSFVERLPVARNDPIVRAGVRMVYYASCPATRASILSTTRELALEPAFGPDGFWNRLGTLRVPAVFVWGRRDWLVSYRFARHVAATLPGAGHRVLRCCGHAPYGVHGTCLAAAVTGALDRLHDAHPPASSRAGASGPFVRVPCLVGA